MMLPCFVTHSEQPPIPIRIVSENDFPQWCAAQPTLLQNWVEATGYRAKPTSYLVVPDETGAIAFVVLSLTNPEDIWMFGQLSHTLPAGCYRIEPRDGVDHFLATMTWGLGAYQFTRYKKQTPLEIKLFLPEEINKHFLNELIIATYLVRDLINTPTEDMGPVQLAEAATKLAEAYGAKSRQVLGEDLLKQGFPLMHAVGRASSQAPRFVEFTWGDEKHPKITLVGKGVCFDSGGLDIKTASGMALMKKDMAGAAHVLGLAQLIMAMKLPIRLRVMIAAVENAVSGNAYRPGDVLQSFKGTTVEITNTDAEGRLVLADPLAHAVEETPEVVFDFSTLTGAARVALGTDIGALFTNHNPLAESLIQQGLKWLDPLWQLPLYKPYRRLLDSAIADMSNASSAPYGGAITAALFLKEFVPDNVPWVHFDVMAWNLSTRPGRPEGGEAMALRAVFGYLYHTYLR